MPTAPAPPRLSICIATFKRARFIGETLESILRQLEPGVEMVVVDGASPDETPAVVAGYAAGQPALRYFREAVNSGFDGDYDKAVGYARGEYCWLMTDDDLLVPGAVRRVLDAVVDDPDLVVVNAETRTPDFSKLVDERLLPDREDRVYASAGDEAFFVHTANMLSFVGAAVVRRDAWMARARTPYFGTLFVHVGVIFQRPALGRVRIVADPQIRIRWGNAMWTPRGFEIWMFKWPGLIWSFDGYSEKARAAVCPREPWRNLRMLGLHRALSGYSSTEYRAYLAGGGSALSRLGARAVALVPRALANWLASLHCLLFAPGARRELYDLAHGRNSTALARWVARRRGL